MLKSLASHILKAIDSYWSTHSAEDASFWQISQQALELAQVLTGSDEAENRERKKR